MTLEASASEVNLAAGVQPRFSRGTPEANGGSVVTDEKYTYPLVYLRENGVWISDYNGGHWL